MLHMAWDGTSGTMGNRTPQLSSSVGPEAALLTTDRTPDFAVPVDRFVAQGAGTLAVISGSAWMSGRKAASSPFPCAGQTWYGGAGAGLAQW